MESVQDNPEHGQAPSMAMPVGLADDAATEKSEFEGIPEVEEDVPGGYMDQQPVRKKRRLPDGPYAATPKACAPPSPKAGMVAPKKELQVEADDIDSLSPDEVSRRLREILVTGLGFPYFDTRYVWFM